MKGLKPYIAIALFALGAVSFAPPRSFAQQYVGVYAGGALPSDGETSPRERFFSDLSSSASRDGVTLSGLGASLSDTEIDPGFVIGGRVGYWLEILNAPWLGVEAELYGAFPKVSGQNITMNLSGSANGAAGAASATVPAEEADLTVLNVGFNLLARYPYSQIQPYAGVGIGIFNGYLDSVNVASPTAVALGGSSFTLDQGEVFFKDDKDTQPALQLLGGGRWFINDKVALFAEYKYVKTELEFQSVQLDYDASQVYGGLEFFFGPGGGVSRPANQPLRNPPWPP